MSQFVKKVKNLATLLNKKAPNSLILLGLFRSKEMPESKWDLVFSANWVKSNYVSDNTYFLDIIKNNNVFDDENVIKINRIIPLAPSSEFVHLCLAKFEVGLEDEPVEISPFVVNIRTGAGIDEAIIIFCKNMN